VTDPVQAIIAAAEAAIRSRETATVDGERQHRSVHLEPEAANGGQVVDTATYLEGRQMRRRKGGEGVQG